MQPEALQQILTQYFDSYVKGEALEYLLAHLYLIRIKSAENKQELMLNSKEDDLMLQ